MVSLSATYLVGHVDRRKPIVESIVADGRGKQRVVLEPCLPLVFKNPVKIARCISVNNASEDGKDETSADNLSNHTGEPSIVELATMIAAHGACSRRQ